jgi:hypothetical protein
MGMDDFSEKRAVPFASEYLKRYEANFLDNIAAIKEWRIRELEAGRPSSLADYCCAHNLCPHCRGVGIALNADGMGYKAIGWDGNTQLFEECESCRGTGQCDENPTA